MKCLLLKDTAVPLLDTVTSVVLSWSVLDRLKGTKTVLKKKISQSNYWLHRSCVPFSPLQLKTLTHNSLWSTGWVCCYFAGWSKSILAQCEILVSHQASLGVCLKSRGKITSSLSCEQRAQKPRANFQKSWISQIFSEYLNDCKQIQVLTRWLMSENIKHQESS